MKTIKNAKITATSLGFWDDHVAGIATAWITLDYSGDGQGFGGHALGGAYTHDFVYGVLKTLEVTSWEKLVGAVCRVEADHGKVYRIGHFLKDQWYDPSAFRDRAP